MKNLISFVILICAISFVNAQPCKKVKLGMSLGEVMKLVGKPTEVDSVGSDTNADGTQTQVIIWQYGDPKKEGNQRVEFIGDKVAAVIADGKKYDELMAAFRHGDVPKRELSDRIKKINSEGCK